MLNILNLQNREEYNYQPICGMSSKVISLYENDNAIEYDTLNIIENTIIATYNVTNTATTTQLLGDDFDLSQITLMYIDERLVSPI